MSNSLNNIRGSVLNSVKLRYQQEKLYTYSGLVLVAMNPFKEMNIYSQEVMKKYCGRSRFDLEPHVFAIVILI
jgi:myosin-5